MIGKSLKIIAGIPYQLIIYQPSHFLFPKREAFFSKVAMHIPYHIVAFLIPAYHKTPL